MEFLPNKMVFLGFSGYCTHKNEKKQKTTCVSEKFVLYLDKVRKKGLCTSDPRACSRVPVFPHALPMKWINLKRANRSKGRDAKLWGLRFSIPRKMMTARPPVFRYLFNALWKESEIMANHQKMMAMLPALTNPRLLCFPEITGKMGSHQNL